MRRLLLFLLALATLPASPADRPNFLVVLTDDLGFSDLGCYGSEIATPTLDRLAANGLRFTQFYNTAKCHSSRVSLLSGRWCRQAGDESLSRAVILPEVLKPAGYFTAMAGKWHLDKQPTDFGFDRFFGHLSGACNYYKGDKSFRLNGQPWQVPAEGFYTTVANVDHGLRFLEEARAQKQPWLLYLAFNAPHAPLQPLEADYRKYRSRYDEGWDVMRARRLAKQQELKLFGQAIEPAPRPDHVPAWNDLKPELRDWEARRMAAYAALIDRVDQELGRLVADLESKGELANTVILFFSDNGACPYDRRSTGQEAEPFDGETAWSDSTGWAWARNSPFRYYKQNQYEGGITTPAIVHWPAGLKTAPGSLVHAPAHLVDVLPTLADLAGAEPPTTFPGRDLSPLAGISLRPILEGKPTAARPPLHFLFSSDRALREGEWKLVSFQRQPWELYDLGRDRTELHNLAAQQPERVQRMAQQWHKMTTEELQAPAREQAPVATEATGQRHREWSDYRGLQGAVTSSRGTEKIDDTPGKKAQAKPGIRARVGTHLKTEGEMLVLDCQGDDPGLAMENLTIRQPGPYRLRFDLQSSSSGGGEVYFTTDPKTRLPGGKHLEFPVVHDRQWHSHVLSLDTAERLHGLRLDPCAGAGRVQIRNLQLLDANDQLLRHWP